MHLSKRKLKKKKKSRRSSVFARVQTPRFSSVVKVFDRLLIDCLFLFFLLVIQARAQEHDSLQFQGKGKLEASAIKHKGARLEIVACRGPYSCCFPVVQQLNVFTAPAI